MTNPKALEAMEKHLRETFNGCQIKDGWPTYESCESAFSLFANEVLKTKREWLNPITLYIIFMKKVKESFFEKDEISGPATGLLRPEVIDQIIKQVLDIVESIPRSYHVYIPLPTARLGIEEVNLTTGIALIEIHDKEKLPSGYPAGIIPTSPDPIFLETDKPYLRLASAGYADASTDDSAFQFAVSTFKQFVYLGIMYRFLEKHEVSLSSSLFGFGPPYHEAIALDLKNPQHLKAHARLPNSVADLINRISINDNLPGLKKAKEGGKDRIEAFLSSQLNNPINLLKRKSNDILSSPIRSALEWAFDADNNENRTVSFIQTCIGLEAILGEDTDQDPSVTGTLADRCAYLLGTNSVTRKKVRNNFKKLYRIRSKVVHGRAATLSHEETGYASWAKLALDGLIFKELESIRK